MEKDLVKEARAILRNYERRNKIKRAYKIGNGEIWLLRICLLLSVLLLVSLVLKV